MSFSESLPRPFFILAPMDDVTDTVFRQIVTECAPPDLYFTEFVNVDGLQSPGRQRLMHKLQLDDKKIPVIAQLWGLNPDNFYRSTQDVIEMGYSGVDLNMGCPVKTVVKNGACAALIKNPQLAGEIIDAAQSGANGKVPVSVKTRTGFNQPGLKWHEFLFGKDLDMLTIHGRTAKQKSLVDADWGLIGQIREMRDQLAPETLVVGNGDVESYEQGFLLAERYKLDGIMIGRGIFDDPFIFSKAGPWKYWGREQRIDLYRKHVELFARTWRKGERRIETLNKFCKVYINGFDGAKELRAQLMAAASAEELLKLLK